MQVDQQHHADIVPASDPEDDEREVVALLRPPQLADAAQQSTSASPPAAGPSTGKKRASSEGADPAVERSAEANGAGSSPQGARAAGPAKKKARKSEPKANTVYCHQDHQAHDVTKTTVLRCTAEKATGKSKAPKQCTITYCARCLQNRKQGLESTGALKKLAQEQGLSNAAELLSVMPSARAASQKASAKLAATFTAGGLPAAQALTKSSPTASGSKKKPAAPRSKKSKKKDREAKPEDGHATDSSLSSLSDSGEDDEDDEDEPAAGPAKKRKKPSAPSGSVSKASSPSAPAEKKTKIFPPRAPPKLASPPISHPLSSVYYSSPHLPCTASLLARLNLREFLLRFLPLFPSLAPSSKRAPAGQHARTLSAICDDVLWLWSDNDLAAEGTQLAILGGLVRFLLKARAGNKLQRENLDDAKDEVEKALQSVSGKVRDAPWASVTEALGSSEWVGKGYEWREEWKAKAGIVDEDGSASGAAKKEKKPDVKGKGKERAAVEDEDDGNESDLSSLSSASSSSSESEYGDVDAALDAGDEDEDDEVDMLGSDFDEEEYQAQKKARRGKFERETPAEERLALCCGLVEMAFTRTEMIREEMAEGTKKQTADGPDLNRQKFKNRGGSDLAEEKKRLIATKPERPPGNGTSEKVKEWQEACKKVDDEIKAAEVKHKKEAWRIQHDMYLSATLHRIRFSPHGIDALGNAYYFLSPPPSALLENPTASATSGFPLNRAAADEGRKDYPLSFCVVVHGKRPLPPKEPSPPAEPADVQRAAASSAKAKPSDHKVGGPALEEFDAREQDEWWVVRGADELDSLATWLDSTHRHADFALRLGEHYTAHPPDAKTNTSHKTKAQIAELLKLRPTAQELEKLKDRMETMDSGLGDAVRQFAQYVRWTKELALQAKEENGDEERVLRERQ
ncbi:hypothetical protein JCM10213v2_004730 [Rhodosporidiobolus nylandii]